MNQPTEPLKHLHGTYCNPLPLPDYPRGMNTYEKGVWGGMYPENRDFRETADPSVIYHDGKWYLYPSCGMAYVSQDFVTWRHHRVDPYRPGYAPTMVVHGEWFYMTASGAPLYRSRDPLGPFESVAPFVGRDGKPIENWADPMLFADDDGRLYAYWGLSDPGIFGAELDVDEPNRMITPPRRLFEYNPDHVWERLGDFNENPSMSYCEGAWMFKHGDAYYLTYAAPGTHWKSYGMGTYVSKRPLGPFSYQRRNPILRDTEGIVHGPGHGCIVRGPNDTIWAFYTCLVRNEHNFERRSGMDPAGIDADGNLFVLGASERPQRAPGQLAHPELGNDAGWLPVTANKYCRASSAREGREAVYAIDNIIRTWWEPEQSDAAPWIEIDLEATFKLGAVRILWKEPGLDYESGAVPGPHQYKFEVSAEAGKDDWTVVLDQTRNDVDMLIDYQPFDPVRARYVRFAITGWPKPIRVGVIEFTVFGVWEG